MGHAGQQMGWHYGTWRGSPTSLGAPISPAVAVPRLSLHRERGVSGAGGCPPHGGTCCPLHGDTMSLPLGPQGPHRLLHRMCTKSVAGDRDAPSLESRWM